jgi:hypothetical protein
MLVSYNKESMMAAGERVNIGEAAMFRQMLGLM